MPDELRPTKKEEFKEDWHVFALIVAVLFVLVVFCGGVAVGCSEFNAWNAHNGVLQLKNDARKKFYGYCQRSYSIGRIDPRCPR